MSVSGILVFLAHQNLVVSIPLPSPSVIVFTLWIVPTHCGCSSTHGCLVAVRDPLLTRPARHLPKSPKLGCAPHERYIKTKISPRTPWHSGLKTVGTSNRTDSTRGGLEPPKDT